MFVELVNTSISASWLILAIIAVRFIFKTMPKAMNCVLWGLVAIRLICPFSIESSLSLVPSAETIPEEVLYIESAQRHDPVQFDGIEVPEILEATGKTAGTTVSQVQAFDVYGSFVWLAGMAVMLLYALIGYLRLRYRVIVSINERDNIWICDQIDSPFILGIFRPRIYMPSGMAEEQAAYVIAHEQAHLHRHDHWWKPFGFLLLSVYWFNPLIWVAYILLSRDIELACDEKVIRSMETADKQAYSEALLVCSVNRRMIAACPLAFGEVGVKARVKSVLNYKKPAFWVIVVSVVICLAIAVCFLTNPKGSDDADSVPLGETISWIYNPDGVAWHEAVHFDFRLEHTHIEASCDRGMLWDLYSEERPKAQSLLFESGNPVCWTPSEGVSENLTEDADIVFAIYSGDQELFSGRLKLVRIDENSDVASYEAVLVEGEGLTLLNADNGLGGVIATSDYSGTFCNHMPGSYISTKWSEAPNPDPQKYDSVELQWDTYTCAFCGTPFDYNTGNYRNSQSVNSMTSSGAQLSKDDFEDPVATAVKLLSRAFSFEPDAYTSTVSQNGDFWNITFDGEHHYVVELTPTLPYPQTLYEYRRVPPSGYGEVEIPVEGELVGIAEDALWSAYALKVEGAQIDVFYYGSKICVQFIMSDTHIFQVYIHNGNLKPSGILFFNKIEAAQMAMEKAMEIQENIEEQNSEEEQVQIVPVNHTQDILDLAVRTVSNALYKEYHHFTPNTQTMDILRVEVDSAESARAAASYFEREDERAITDPTQASQMIAVKAVYHVDWIMDTESNKADAGVHADYYYVMPSPSVPGRWYIHDIVPTSVPQDLELPQPPSLSKSYTPVSLKSYGTSESAAASQLDAQAIWTPSESVVSKIYKRDGENPALYLVTKDGMAGELPLPYNDDALPQAKTKNSHLDLNYNIYYYEVEVPEQVVDPNNGKVLAEAGTYRYFVDMVEFRYLMVFVPDSRAVEAPIA